MRQILVAMIAVAAILALPAGAVAPTDESEIDRAIANDPGLAAIVQADPAREAEIRDRLHRAFAHGPEALLQEAMALGRRFAEVLLPQVVGYAPDAAVLEFLEGTLAALDEASAQSGARCHTFLTGGLSGGEMPVFSTAVHRRLGISLADIVATGSARDSQRMLGEKEFYALLDQALTRTYEIAGDNPVDFDAVANLMAIQDDRTKAQACTTTIYFYRAILALPRSDAAALFRTLMAEA